MTATWARWDRGNRRVWHETRRQVRFMSDSDNYGKTLCGVNIPSHAMIFTGEVKGANIPVCARCVASKARAMRKGQAA